MELLSLDHLSLKSTIFCENSLKLLGVNYFRKKANIRYLTGSNSDLSRIGLIKTLDIIFLLKKFSIKEIENKMG